METSPHCTLSLRDRRLNRLWVLALTPFVLVVHGYHPFAEDGGLYVAGVQFTLDPTLFPHETAFVTEHLRFSLFAPLLAQGTRLSHLTLPQVLLACYLVTAALTLLAAMQIVERSVSSLWSQRTAVALFAAVWTTPVAGTSLLLMDPYLTARSFALPFSLLALGHALDDTHAGPRRRLKPLLACGFYLMMAGAFHPLMAGYAFGLALAIRSCAHPRSVRLWMVLGGGSVVIASVVQGTARNETPAAVAAALSRYYWFLSQWQWYEQIGLAGPLLVLLGLLRWRRAGLGKRARTLAHAAIGYGLLASTVTVLFAQEHFPAHAVARLQPLRCFVLIYVILFLLLGAALGKLFNVSMRGISPPHRNIPGIVCAASLIVAISGGMYVVQRQTFPDSPYVELPGHANPNAWVQAFVWARNHTPVNSTFALDPRYINRKGEDAQTFRAVAQRSALPDFSKDGGEAAITPELAPEWYRDAAATHDLSGQSDQERDARLQALSVDWMVLDATARTAHACPFRNTVVKVCSLGARAAAGSSDRHSQPTPVPRRPE